MTHADRGAIAGPIVAAATLILAGIGFTVAIEMGGLNLEKTPIYPENNRQVSAIPTETEHWERIGSDRVMSSEIVETLGTENYVSRDYVRKGTRGGDNPDVVEFHAAYYTGGIDTVPHVPERCFVGGGLQQSESARIIPLDLDTSTWRVDRSVPAEYAGLSGELYTVRLSSNREWTDAPGVRVRLPRDVTPENPIEMRCSEFIFGEDRKVYAGYFFVANGGVRANANDVRTLAFNLKDDYAYYLKVQVTSTTAGSFGEFADQAEGLISDLLGEIMLCTPDWVEVQMGRYPESDEQ